MLALPVLAAKLASAAGPTLSYSTLLGGRDYDSVSAVAIGKDGSLYAAGRTHSTNFPVRNAAWSGCEIGPLGSCSDAFLLRLSPDGGSLIFSTYLRLSNTGSDEVLDLELDSEGNVYVAGMSSSNSGFAGKFTPEGGLVYLVRISGYPITIARGVAADGQGNAYVTGVTLSGQFPVSNPLKPAIGAPSCTPAGGSPFPQDAFLTKLDPRGNVIYSTFLGGDGNDGGIDVAADAEGNAYVVGSTSSLNFPTVNAVQTEYKGGHRVSPGACDGGDLFLAKIDPAGQRLIYSTYFGGTGNDEALGVLIDDQSQPVVYGSTSSGDLPTKGNWPVPTGGSFVVKFAGDGANLIYSGYLWPGVTDLAIDGRGLLYAAGWTNWSGLPQVEPLRPFVGGACGSMACEDAYVVAFDPLPGTIRFSSYLGGPGPDFTGAIAVDGRGSVFVAGSTYANGFPLLNPFQGSSGGHYDAFLAKIGGVVPPLRLLAVVSSASFAGGGRLAPDSIASGFGEGLGERILAATTLPLPTELDGVEVKVRDAAGIDHPASLFFVSPTQVNFLVPSSVPDGEARVTVHRGGQAVAESTASVSRTAPALYSANASGTGVAAAVATHVASDGTQTHELIFDESAPPGQRTALPLAWRSESDQLILLLFGTGIRGRQSLTSVRAEIGGEKAEVLYAGEQPSHPGLDQVNLRVPRALAGRGEAPITFSVDGAATNTLTVRFR